MVQHEESRDCLGAAELDFKHVGGTYDHMVYIANISFSKKIEVTIEVSYTQNNRREKRYLVKRLAPGQKKYLGNTRSKELAYDWEIVGCRYVDRLYDDHQESAVSFENTPYYCNLGERSMCKVPKVHHLSVDIIKTNPPLLSVYAVGSVPSYGWQGAALVPHYHSLPPENGIYKFGFIAIPPLFQTTVLTTMPIVASYLMANPPVELTGVHVCASSNSIDAPVDDSTNQVPLD